MTHNNRLIVGMLIIVAVLAAGVGGVIAYLFAQRTVTGSRFAAGTIDLDVASNNVELDPFVIDNMGENGAIGGTKTWTVHNSGTLPGRLLVRLQGLHNKDNGCNDQEKIAEPTCESDDDGELGQVIDLKFALDGVDKVNSTLAQNNQTQFGQDWSALTPIILNAGETKTVTAYWSADEDSYSNEVQSDSVEFNVDFRLIQQIAGPTPTNI